MFNFFKKIISISESVVVIDSRFPRPLPFGFRNTEINEYFKRLPDFKSYTMHIMKPGKKAWFAHSYGIDEKTFIENKKSYLKYYPENADKIRYLYPDRKYKIKLAYVFFLAETYTLLPFLNKYKINFVFVLFPGGGFGLNYDKSDDMLREVFKSKYFKKVIVTKNITYDYLVKNKLCDPSRIEFLRGFVQLRPTEVIPRRYYKKDKNTLDICFIAAKYSEKGVDKGYDLFIEAAKKMNLLYDDVRFHVIGGFSEKDISINELGDKVKFYGFQQPDSLIKLYSKMDILLSPNRAFKLYPGNFDGFPLGADAGCAGVVLFVSDELNQNIYIRDKEEFVLIKSDINDIMKKLIFYHDNPNKLIEISRKGSKAMFENFSIDEQCKERIKIFKSILNKDD